MPSAFTNTDITVGATRTLVYTATGVTAIIFSGLATNVDAANRVDHEITLERCKSNGTDFFNKFKSIPIAYGGSLPLPKIILKPGESLYATADQASAIQLSLEIVERS